MEPAELLERNIWEVFPAGKETDSYRIMQQAMEAKQIHQYESYSAFLDQWVNINLYPTDQGLSVYFQDITMRKQAEAALVEYADKLKRSNQELEQFAFVASHDLQEPLRKIIRFGDSVADRLTPGMDENSAAEVGDYLHRMQNAAERMQAMIDGLQDLSRVATQAKPFETVALAQLAAEVISDLEPRIHQARGQVQLGALPEIEADPMQMRQLLQNLIGNALKFHQADTPPVIRVGSEIFLAKHHQPGRVVLTITDNGIGFDAQDAGRIFQPFQRLHGRGEYEGTGLGLAICQKIVERHHGTITVHSQPGEGSTFTIELPLRQPA
jgi:signal transduction histidine kinase